MKLASLPRRSYRRPSRLQRFNSPSSETDAPAFFSASRGSEPRLKAESFFSPRLDSKETIQPQAEVKEEEPVKAQKDKDEPLQAKQDDLLAQAPEKEEEVAPRADQLPQAEPGKEDEMKPKCECGSCASCSSKEDQNAAGIMAKAEGAAGQTAHAAQGQGASCTSAQRPVIDSSLASARQMSGRAQQVIQSARIAALRPSETSDDAIARYEKWFGAFDPARAWFVEHVYSQVHRDLSASEIEFFCNCDRNWYAYVCKNDGAMRIWLCRLFWKKARSSGFNSRPGTIIHELAHQASGNVLDYGYGVSRAQYFAISHPGLAISNAENYSCFSESL